MSESLNEAKTIAGWDNLASSPDDRSVPYLLTGILHALIAIAESPAVPVDPGACWHDSGITWPGYDFPTRCELKAGHAGAHEASCGSMGGTATWLETAPSPAQHAAPEGES